jgi:LDH2 family malate/lactate/ureidoglycolate dehydrogenase
MPGAAAEQKPACDPYGLIVYDIAEARTLAADVLAAHGMPRDHADTGADHFVDAAGAGHALVGRPRVMALVGNMKESPRGAPITIEEKTPNLVMTDGGRNNG